MIREVSVGMMIGTRCGVARHGDEQEYRRYVQLG